MLVSNTRIIISNITIRHIRINNLDYSKNAMSKVKQKEKQKYSTQYIFLITKIVIMTRLSKTDNCGIILSMTKVSNFLLKLQVIHCYNS